MQFRLEFNQGNVQRRNFCWPTIEIKHSIKTPHHMPRIKGFASKGISAKITNLSRNTQMHQTSYEVLYFCNTWRRVNHWLTPPSWAPLRSPTNSKFPINQITGRRPDEMSCYGVECQMWHKIHWYTAVNLRKTKWCRVGYKKWRNAGCDNPDTVWQYIPKNTLIKSLREPALQ